MRRRKPKPSTLVDGLPCLDFINTAPAADGHRTEELEAFDDVLDSLCRARLIPTAAARQAAGHWTDRAKRRLHAKALIFRMCLRDMVETILANRKIPQKAIPAINEVLRSQTAYPRLIRTRGAIVQRFERRLEHPDQLLEPIADSVSDLLCNRDWSRLGKCANPGCKLFFYDTTRNHRRRWCSMKTCGNRMKAAAFRRRQHATRIKRG